MSGLVDRITAVQREHVSAQTENWETKLRCECGQGDFSSKLEYSRHVAERVAEALQLTEEWAHKGRAFPDDDEDEIDEWSCGHPIITPTRHGVVHEGFETPVRRWVSGWSAVEEEKP